MWGQFAWYDAVWSAFSFVVGLLMFVIVLGVLVLLVRFLLIGTRAAELYLAQHRPVDSPAAGDAAAAPTTTAPPAAPTTPAENAGTAASATAAEQTPSTTSAAETTTEHDEAGKTTPLPAPDANPDPTTPLPGAAPAAKPAKSRAPRKPKPPAES